MESIEKDEKIKAPFLKRLENFWYHYKWHSIVALFLAITVTVCALQLGTKDSYDVHIMYAGGKSITHTTDDQSEYTLISSALKRVTTDFDGDGLKTPSFLNLYVPSPAEIEQLREEGKADMLAKLIQSDGETLENNMIFSSEFYICFLSESVFMKYDKDQTVDPSTVTYPFVSISDYADPNESYEYASERGIYLRSTGFYSLPGIKDLPEDTVICMRVRSTVFASKDGERLFKNSEQVLRDILAY